MAKRPTVKQIREHYAADIKAASDKWLWGILNDEVSPKYIGEALAPLAIEELKRRGHEMPLLARLFVLN